MKLTIILLGFLVICVFGSELDDVCNQRRRKEKEGYDDFYTLITLVSSPNLDHVALNAKFERIATGMGFEVVVDPLYLYADDNFIKESINNINGAIDGVINTLIAADLNSNVINLQMSIKDLHSDYLKYKHFLKSNLICATDCDNESLTYTRLVTDTLFRHPQLLQIIRSEDLELGDYIQICLPRNTPNLIEKVNLKLTWPLKIKLEECESSIKPDNSKLAIITNEPSDTYSLLPTIFYQTPYIHPEVKDIFPNSLILSTKWQPLKYAFKEFLKHMDWYRVAILSDDSIYSLEFLKELFPLLMNEGMAITDQKCSGSSCDFNDPLKTLKAADSRIIILNVDKRNSRKLVDTINNLNMVGVVWIVRDWPFDKLETKVMSEVFSIFLSPTFREEDKFYPYLSSIKEGIKKIVCIYKSVLGDREMFRRVFAEEATQPKNFKTNGYITRIHKHGNPTLVAGMTIEGGLTKYFHLTKPYNGPAPSDTPEPCVVRSRNFFKPCNHEVLLLLMAVCVVFSLSLLVIVECFYKYRSSRFYNRIP